MQSRTGKARIDALLKRRGSGQGDEVRHIVGQRVQQIDGVVAARAADVDVLTEHGELLGQIAIQFGNFFVARVIDDAPVVPMLERMRAAAAEH